jgi:hypothetical protein
MEILLQWLDEVDDAFYAWALGPRRISRFSLSVSLIVTLVLAVCRPLVLGFEWTAGLTALAFFCVVLWMLAAVAEFVQRHRRLSGLA